jgi:predicted hydrolase (HD superfamily)
MSLPTRSEAEKLLEENVRDTYQKLHARMVASALEGYAKLLGEDPELWYITGLLHDIDFEKHPDTHPKESLGWFKEWSYPGELIQAVEAHAYGYNGFSTLPESKLDFTLMACDEICGIFYAYKKLNPIPYREMKVKSIKKRLAEKSFAPKIERRTVYMGCDGLGVDIDTHIENLTKFLPEEN